MLYEIDSSKIDIFEMAKSGSKLVSIGGQMSFTCRTSDATDAISFTTPESYLVRVRGLFENRNCMYCRSSKLYSHDKEKNFRCKTSFKT